MYACKRLTLHKTVGVQRGCKWQRFDDLPFAVDHRQTVVRNHQRGAPRIKIGGACETWLNRPVTFFIDITELVALFDSGYVIHKPARFTESRFNDHMPGGVDKTPQRFTAQTYLNR